MQSLEREQHRAADALKGQLKEDMRIMASRISTLGPSMQDLKSELRSLMSSAISARSQALSDEVKDEMVELQTSLDQTHVTLARLSSSTLRVQDSSGLPPCADSFDLPATSNEIRFAHSDALDRAASNSERSMWRTVYGNHVVEHGKYQWQLKIERTNPLYHGCCMVVGVANQNTETAKCLNQTHDGFGYMENGNKTHSSQGYGTPYDSGDVVTVVLDMVNFQLSFMKNKKDMGVSHQLPPNLLQYRLAVSLHKEHAVRILSSGAV